MKPVLSSLQPAALGIDAHDQRRRAGLHHRRVQLDQHRGLRLLLRRHDEVLAHDLELARGVLQLELDGHLARGLVHHADGVEVAEVAVGHLLEEGALGAQQRGLHVRAREDEECQAAPPSASSTTV